MKKTQATWLQALVMFLGGAGFPAFALFLMFFYQALIALLIFTPAGDNFWGELAEEFRIRCFRFDPSSRSMDWGAAWMMLLEPLPLYPILYFIWRKPLQELRRFPKRIASLGSTAFLVVLFMAAGLVALNNTPAEVQARPFPGERLRSALPMPSFSFADQDGRLISKSDLSGKVVLLTAVYSSCTTTCPMILKRIRSVLDELSASEQEDLVVVAFSLNPEQDTAELRTMTSKIYNMAAPQFHFVNGLPQEMNQLLDDLGIVRQKDPETGTIMHSNFFFVLDRSGKIAFRLSLSEQEETWVIDAVRRLLKEKAS